jgi:hypothetical protein
MQLVDPCEPLHLLSKPNDDLIVEIKTNHVHLLGLTQLPFSNICDMFQSVWPVTKVFGVAQVEVSKAVRMIRWEVHALAWKVC